MGKGLDLQPTGVHVAFTAGTGVLPFLDLFYKFDASINNLELSEGKTAHADACRMWKLKLSHAFEIIPHT